MATGERNMGVAGRRILIGKPGLDGHDAGAKVIALALRDAGAEVIYTGLRKTPAFIAQVAVDEDVDAVGLSILSGGHVALVRDTRAALDGLAGGDIALFVGGTIPQEDVAGLREAGASGVYNATMRIDDVIADMGRVLAARDAP